MWFMLPVFFKSVCYSWQCSLFWLRIVASVLFEWVYYETVLDVRLIVCLECTLVIQTMKSEKVAAVLTDACKGFKKTGVLPDDPVAMDVHLIITCLRRVMDSCLKWWEKKTYSLHVHISLPVGKRGAIFDTNYG